MVYIIDKREYRTLKQDYFEKHPNLLTGTDNAVSKNAYQAVPEICLQQQQYYRRVRSIVRARMDVYLNGFTHIFAFSLIFFMFTMGEAIHNSANMETTINTRILNL